MAPTTRKRLTVNHSNKVLIGLCALLVLFNGWLLYENVQLGGTAQAAPAPPEEEEPELAAFMGTMQRYSQKLMLSTRAENAQAASFYLHELEELSEEIEEEVPTYEGHPIADLIGSMLMPEIEELEESLDRGKWDDVQAKVQSMTAACNQCHQSTEHGFIHITASDVPNAFNQQFEE